MSFIKPDWGLKNVIPADASAWWGARAIIEGDSFSLLWDRQSAGPEQSPELRGLGEEIDRLLPKMSKNFLFLRERERASFL